MMQHFDTKLYENVGKINTSMDEKIAALKQDINGDLLMKSTANEAAIDTQDQLETVVMALKDTLQKSGKVNDLIIKGIPILPNEQPQPLYLKIDVAIE
jgi:hypothetical protein